MTEQTNLVKEMVKKFSSNESPLNEVPIKLETKKKKKKYQNDTDRLNARKEQQKKYRERQKEKVKELLLLIDGLDADDIVELKNRAQELRQKNIVDE